MGELPHTARLLTRPVRLGAVVLAATLVVGVAPARAAGRAADAREAAERGVAYVVARQAADGRFFSSQQAADATAETLAALVAAGGPEAAIDAAIEAVADAGEARARERAAYAGRIVAGLVAAGRDPRAFAGVDHVEILESFYNPVTGAYDAGVYANALAVLGVAAARGSVPEQALVYLEVQQCREGGFSHAEGCTSPPDTDTTAAVLSALVAGGRARSAPSVVRARAWLIEARNGEGGFGVAAGEPTNGNSTGLALSAIAALGEKPSRPPWADGDRDPLRALLALAHASGGFRYLASQEDPNDYATVQALPGLVGAPYPIRPRARPDAAPPAVGKERDAPVAAGRPSAAPVPDEPARDRHATAHPPASGGTVHAAGGARGEAPASRTPLAVLALAGIAMTAGPLAARTRRRRSA